MTMNFRVLSHLLITEKLKSPLTDILIKFLKMHGDMSDDT